MIDIQEYSVPEKISEARKWKIVRHAQVAVSSAIRRWPAATSDEQSSAAPPCPPPLPACRDFSTWASNRDLWQWILKSRFLSFVILKVSRGKVEILSKEIIRIRCFQINKENWWWWIHFSRSLTLAALKGALVTLCRPLSAGLRISFQLKVNSQVLKWYMCLSSIFGLLHQDFPPRRVSTAISPWIHQFSSDHWS